jgi:hypothetical protein
VGRSERRTEILSCAAERRRPRARCLEAAPRAVGSLRDLWRQARVDPRPPVPRTHSARVVRGSSPVRSGRLRPSLGLCAWPMEMRGPPA